MIAHPAIKPVFGLIALFALAVKSSPATLLDDGFRQLYNLQFAQAHQTFLTHQRQNPRDPLGPVAEAAGYLFSEFDRLDILRSEFLTQDQSILDFRKPKTDPAVKKQFTEALERSKQLAGSSTDANSLFATSLGLGLQADYLCFIERRNIDALTATKQSKAIADQLLAKAPGMYDAYIAEGVENYLLSLKSAPVRWFLRMGGAQTDRSRGLEKLRLTAEKGHYLLPYARLLLAIADLRDHAPERARPRLEWLVKEFPQNRLYRDELAKLRM